MATAISLKDVSFTYLHAPAPSIRDINLEIEEGSVTAIVGQTGAGKSTLLKTMNAILPSIFPGDLKGKIVVADQELTEETETAQMARYINMVFDDPVLQIVSLTVDEDVAFGPANLNLPREEIWERVRSALASTRLEGYEKRNPHTMSGGEQQLLAIAGVLAMRPKILGLDEPVAMLDPLGKAQVLNVVRDLNKEFGTTVLIAESGTDIEAVCEFADQLVLMHDGRILATGPTDEIFARRDLIEEAQLKVPQVTRLFWNLNGASGKTVPTSLDNGLKLLNDKLGEPSSEEEAKAAAPVVEVVDTPEREPAIIVKNLHRTFPGEPPVHALAGIDLTIYKGEMVALLGQNGSGKTTLSYHLVGVEKPSNPDAVIEVDGVNVITAPTSETVRHINYLFQNPANQLFCETFKDEVSFGPKQMNLTEEEVEKRAREALEMMDLGDQWDNYTLGIPRSQETLLSLASVLTMNPQILIADEPTGGLDHAASTKVMETLVEVNKTGRTIIVITHDMDLAATYADRIVVLRKGEVLLDGTPEEVFSQTDILASTQLYPPQITRLAQNLAPYGIPRDVLSVDRMVDELHKRMQLKA